MNGVLNKNAIVKKYEFDEPHIQKIDSIIDNCIRDCHHKHFHTFDQRCEYDINLRNITNNDLIDFTISDESMGLYELNKK